MSTVIKLRRSAVPGKKPTTAQLEIGEVVVNTYDGKLFTKVDNTSQERVVELGAFNYARKTSNYTALSKDNIIADTTGGSFTVTLPSNPEEGDYVQIADGGDWSINSLTVDRNGSTIEDNTENFILDIGKIRVEFIFDGYTWQVYTNLGKQGEKGYTGSQGIQGPIGYTGSTPEDLDGGLY